MAMPAADPALLPMCLLIDLVDHALDVGPIWAKQPREVPGPRSRWISTSNDELTVVFVSEERPASLSRAPRQGIPREQLTCIRSEPNDLSQGWWPQAGSGSSNPCCQRGSETKFKTAQS